MKHFCLYLSLCSVLFFISSGAFAQKNIKDGLFKDDYQINPENKGLLGLSIDNLSFLKDNESDGDIMDGYTLPGFRIQPHVYFYPTSFVKLEAGVSLLRFWGADKYPCYTYQNIAEWKADDYQYGFHVLPFFRAQIQASKQINLVFGSLYGGSNHQLIEPLYNPELNLSADPECGLQFLYNSRIANADVWVNWESFTFKDDTHNEAFTIGTSAALNITPETSFFHLSLPLQVVGVHRGGEIDTVEQHITTMINAATGLSFKFNTNRRLLQDITLQLMVAGYDAPSGQNLFYTRGWALYPNISATMRNFKLNFGWWRSSDYINIFGNPIYENVSLTIDRVFPKVDVFNGHFMYEQPFGNGIFLGVDAEMFYIPKLTGYDPPNMVHVAKVSKSSNYSFGAYLRINPSIILGKKKIN